LKFKKPARFPQNSLRANRLLWLGLRVGWGASFALAVLEAQFVQGEAIDDLSALSRMLRELNLDPELVREADGDDARTGLREETEAAARLGIFGAPSFTVGEELFWGDDRLDEALQWSRGCHAAQAEGMTMDRPGDGKSSGLAEA
jgi:2-hydroxychromene-2-carboxylate isomerase